MNILIISDLHLSRHFDSRKFNLLKKLIGSVDHVIINGDFWEGYEITFEEFLKTNWKQLFPLLKSKKTVYIYGNHDPEDMEDNRVELFSDIQTRAYTLKVGEKELVFEHGNRLCPLLDERFVWDFLPEKGQKIAHDLADSIQHILTRCGEPVVKFFFKRLNKRIIKKATHELKPNQILVCGHTHCSQFTPEDNFINTGFFNFGYAQYLIIEGEKLIPKNERY
ncbi:MAG: metallophosphoesterase family protein [Candidatus Roizmanbacteria bacterium]